MGFRFDSFVIFVFFFHLFKTWFAAFGWMCEFFVIATQIRKKRFRCSFSFFEDRDFNKNEKKTRKSIRFLLNTFKSVNFCFFECFLSLEIKNKNRKRKKCWCTSKCTKTFQLPVWCVNHHNESISTKLKRT